VDGHLRVDSGPFYDVRSAIEGGVTYSQGCYRVLHLFGKFVPAFDEAEGRSEE